ncbi:MAG: type II toxin-antitoxin system VapC family toxin [Woeseia sp.]
MTFVLDASVIVKWLLQDPQRESDSHAATRLVETVIAGTESVLQPPHWLVEVGAVLARASPDTALDDVALLSALELPAADDPRALRRACEMAIDLKQHLFDTLYHAVALEAPDAVLITADERYFRAARSIGRITKLRDWSDNTKAG